MSDPISGSTFRCPRICSTTPPARLRFKELGSCSAAPQINCFYSSPSQGRSSSTRWDQAEHRGWSWQGARPASSQESNSSPFIYKLLEILREDSAWQLGRWLWREGKRDSAVPCVTVPKISVRESCALHPPHPHCFSSQENPSLPLQITKHHNPKSNLTNPSSVADGTTPK